VVTRSGWVSEIRPNPLRAVDNRDYQQRKYPVLIYNRDGQTTREYMAVGGHVVSNKSSNCLENFWVFRGTRRFFDAVWGDTRTGDSKILGVQIPATGGYVFSNLLLLGNENLKM
jgi:hypothetical protein